MKKILAVLLLAVFVGPLFADDALVLPEGVWRIRLIPSVTFNSEAFDDDGERQDQTLYDSAATYNLSGAIEYGVNPWINAAMQWFPGWRITTTFDNPENDNQQSKGLNDLFVGGKFQIVGEEAPVASDAVRFAVSTGVLVPLTTFDAEEAGEAAFEDDDFRLARVDNDAWAAGYRLHFDYIVNANFFINLYNELIYYFPTDQDNDVSGWATYFGTEALAPGAGTEPEEVEYEYGYDMTFEIEPQYSQMVGSGLELGASLPVSYAFSPEDTIDGTGAENESYTLALAPSVSALFTTAPWPIELELTYATTVAGKNAAANNSVVLQVKNFLRFW